MCVTFTRCPVVGSSVAPKPLQVQSTRSYLPRRTAIHMLLNTESKLDIATHQNFCVRVLSNKCSKIALLSRGQAFFHHFNMTNVFRSYAYDQLRSPPTYTMICRSARPIQNGYQRFAACTHSPLDSAGIILVQDSN